MPRKEKKPDTEIVTRTEAIVQVTRDIPDLEALIARIVDERLAKAMEDAGVENFLPKELSYEARHKQDLFERKLKWTLYFEQWGCVRCERKDVAHSAKGFCQACYSTLHTRLRRIKVDYAKADPERAIEQDIDNLTRRMRAAEEI